MCGLIAIVSKTNRGFTQKEISLFQTGLYATALRGTDATGCFSVTSDGNVHMLKAGIMSADFIRTPEYQEFENTAYLNSRIMVGHCRSATKGEKTDINAHPFIANNLILVHNGTLWHHKNLADTETDSEAIAIALSEKKADEILSNLSGAYALLWYNAQTKLFYASRNKERPLWILQTKDFDFIGSEPGLLEWLQSRSGNTKIDAKYFDVDIIYSWKLTDLKDSFIETKIKKKFYPLQKIYTQPIGGNTNLTHTLHLDIHINDIITFKVLKTTYIYNTVYIEGENPKYKNTTFRCYLHTNTKNDKELEKENYISGYVTGKIATHNLKKTTIVLSYPFIPDKTTITLEDINGQTENIEEKNLICSRCNVTITKKDTKRVWFRIKNNLVKNIYCPTCVEQNTNLQIKT